MLIVHGRGMGRVLIILYGIGGSSGSEGSAMVVGEDYVTVVDSCRSYLWMIVDVSLRKSPTRLELTNV